MVNLKEFYQLLQQWIHQVDHVEDVTIRRRVMTERLAALSPEQLSEALHFILRCAQMGRRPFQNALDAVTDLEPLVELLGRYHFSQVYVHAREHGYDEVVQFLSSPRPDPTLEPSPPPDPNQLASEVTLGERRAMAMRPDPRTMEKLMYDPEPMVIHKLLLNPRMTLPLVVRIASRRPNHPDVLREIFNSSRWSTQYEIKLALVRNPYSAPDMVIRLLPALRLQDLRDVVNDARLTADIREAARTQLRQRPHGASQVE